MKGLMVSLIIVIFAGMTSSVIAAGQQTGQDASGFKPRLGLQPNAAPSSDRPGPDDSDDDFAWPDPASLLPRESTNTSSLGDRQLGGPTPASAMGDNIRFDVKVDENAIRLLRQGQKVYSQVDVRDRSNMALNPDVVSDIALFLEDNAGKNLQGLTLYPQPMERDSSILRFEIPEQQLDRIEKDAFLFKVPDDLRGKFDRVEFVAVSGPSSSQEFSGGVTSGPRGSGLGFGNPNETRRFTSSENDQFGSLREIPRETPREASRFSIAPKPGPGIESGDYRFMGPSIDSVELQRRNRIAMQEPNRNFEPPTDFARSQVNTGGQFRLAERDRPVEPIQNRFSLPREQSTSNQNTRNENTFGQNQNTFGQTRNDFSQDFKTARQRSAKSRNRRCSASAESSATSSSSRN